MSVSTTPAASLSYTELTSVDIGAGPHVHIAYSGVANLALNKVLDEAMPKAYPSVFPKPLPAT